MLPLHLLQDNIYIPSPQSVNFEHLLAKVTLMILLLLLWERCPYSFPSNFSLFVIGLQLSFDLTKSMYALTYLIVTLGCTW